MSDARAARAKMPSRQIVAQQRVVRNFASQRLFKRVDVVNPFPGIRSLSEKILVDIGNGEGIRIHPARAGKNFLKERSLTIGRERRRDARLDDRISFHDAPFASAELRPIEGMRHRPHQTGRRAARQARVCIERDDVADAGDCFRMPPACGNERCVGTPAQEAGSARAACRACAPTPSTFLEIRSRRAFDGIERIARRRPGAGPWRLIQSRDAAGCGSQQFVVAGQALGRSVHPIGEQRKTQISVRICQDSGFPAAPPVP